MKKSREFEEILNECLERLLLRGESVEQCLARYPELADELKPLLETAIAAKEASVVVPRSEFKARARYQFLSALKEVPKRKRFFIWRSAWATALAFILAFLLIGSGTVAAASGSMPDEALYPVKLATEQVWLKFAFSPEAKARVYAALADRRVREIIYMADKGEAQGVERSVTLLSAYLATIPNLVSEKAEVALKSPPAMAPIPAAGGVKEEVTRPRGHPKLRAILLRNAARHPLLLRAALRRASPEVKPTLLQALQILELGYQKALATVGE